MMAILMGTYYGFFLPQIINTYIDYDPVTKIYSSNLLFVFFFMNAIINPLVYGWMSPDFNLAFRSILGLKIDDKKFARTSTGSVYIKRHSEKKSLSAVTAVVDEVITVSTSINVIKTDDQNENT